MTPKITNEGFSLLIQCLDGTGLTFSKFVLGDGEPLADYRISNHLSHPVIDVPIESIERDEDEHYIKLTGTFDNSKLNDGFNWTEIGIFCKNPCWTSENEIPDLMYAYAHCQLESDVTSAAFIPKRSYETFTVNLTYRIYVGELEGIKAAIAANRAYVTQRELIEHTDDVKNPHRVTAEQVGLGNVENVAVNDMRPSFEDAAAVEAIDSGERLSSIFSKLSRMVKDFVVHVTAKNPHGMAPSDIDAAEAVHEHNANDITTGVLKSTRGGTGVNSLSALWDILWQLRDATLDNNKGIYAKGIDGKRRLVAKINESSDMVFGDGPESGGINKTLRLVSPGSIEMVAHSGIKDGEDYVGYTMKLSQEGSLIITSNSSNDSGARNIGSMSERFGTFYGRDTNLLSDRKKKNHIGDIRKAHELIMGLKPIEFSWKDDQTDSLEYGFYAQDVFKLVHDLGIEKSGLYQAQHKDQFSIYGSVSDEEIINMDDEDLSWGLNYIQLITPMVAVIQEQEKRIKELEDIVKGER